MTHYMRLDFKPFEMIEKGYKTIELRLNDEKRKKLNIGDEIIFSNNSDPTLILRVEVMKLHLFPTFCELYKSLPLDKCGYLPNDVTSASFRDMEEYYSVDEQKKYGVVGIEIKVV